MMPQKTPRAAIPLQSLDDAYAPGVVNLTYRVLEGGRRMRNPDYIRVFYRIYFQCIVATGYESSTVTCTHSVWYDNVRKKMITLFLTIRY